MSLVAHFAQLIKILLSVPKSRMCRSDTELRNLSRPESSIQENRSYGCIKMFRMQMTTLMMQMTLTRALSHALDVILFLRTNYCDCTNVMFIIMLEDSRKNIN